MVRTMGSGNVMINMSMEKSVMAIAICPYCEPLQFSSRAITVLQFAEKSVPQANSSVKKNAIDHKAINTSSVVVQIRNQFLVFPTLNTRR